VFAPPRGSSLKKSQNFDRKGLEKNGGVLEKGEFVEGKEELFRQEGEKNLKK